MAVLTLAPPAPRHRMDDMCTARRTDVLKRTKKREEEVRSGDLRINERRSELLRRSVSVSVSVSVISN
jgi:hypothetical protein